MLLYQWCVVDKVCVKILKYILVDSNYSDFNCQYSTKIAAFLAAVFPITPIACPALDLITVAHLVLAVRVPSFLVRGVATA